MHFCVISFLEISKQSLSLSVFVYGPKKLQKRHFPEYSSLTKDPRTIFFQKEKTAWQPWHCVDKRNLWLVKMKRRIYSERAKIQPLPKVLRVQAIRSNLSNYVTYISATYTRTKRRWYGATAHAPPRNEGQKLLPVPVQCATVPVTVTDNLFKHLLQKSPRPSPSVPRLLDDHADLFRAPLHEVLPPLALHIMEPGGIPDMVFQ